MPDLQIVKPNHVDNAPSTEKPENPTPYNVNEKMSLLPTNELFFLFSFSIDLGFYHNSILQCAVASLQNRTVSSESFQNFLLVLRYKRNPIFTIVM